VKPRRSRKSAQPAVKPGFRVCSHCGVDHGRDGPRPFGSVIRSIDRVLVYACSEQCARELGWL
jgi:hypothetical protein